MIVYSNTQEGSFIFEAASPVSLSTADTSVDNIHGNVFYLNSTEEIQEDSGYSEIGENVRQNDDNREIENVKQSDGLKVKAPLYDEVKKNKISESKLPAHKPDGVVYAQLDKSKFKYKSS